MPSWSTRASDLPASMHLRRYEPTRSIRAHIRFRRRSPVRSSAGSSSRSRTNTAPSVVAHGCTGKGNDQVRIELAVRALDPGLTCRAPLRESPLTRPDAIAFAREHGVPVAHTAEKPYSIDANLWGRSIEAGVLEDPWNSPPEDAFAWTAGATEQPATPQEIVVEFHSGEPALRREHECRIG